MTKPALPSSGNRTTRWEQRPRPADARIAGEREGRVRVGIAIDESPNAGGLAWRRTVTQSVTIASALSNAHDVIILSPDAETVAMASRLGASAHQVEPRGFGPLDELAQSRWGEDILRRLSRRVQPPRFARAMDASIDAFGIDVLICPSPGPFAARTGDHLLVTGAPDLAHRDHPEFPEFRRSREFERRDRMLRRTLPRSLAVLVPSADIGVRVAGLYHVDRDRLVAMPPSPAVAPTEAPAPAPGLQVLAPGNLTPLGNHVLVVEALAEIRRTGGPALRVVIAGREMFPGYMDTIRGHAMACGVADAITIVPDVTPNSLARMIDESVFVVTAALDGSGMASAVDAAARHRASIGASFPGDETIDGIRRCHPTDAGALARLMVAAVADRRHTDAGGRRAHEYFDEASRGGAEALRKTFDDYAHLRMRWSSPSTWSQR